MANQLDYTQKHKICQARQIAEDACSAVPVPVIENKIRVCEASTDIPQTLYYCRNTKLSCKARFRPDDYSAVNHLS